MVVTRTLELEENDGDSAQAFGWRLFRIAGAGKRTVGLRLEGKPFNDHQSLI